MGKVIPVTVRDKIASAPKDTLYICGNSDFVIRFDFDEEWSEHAVKTARFAYNGTHQDVIFEGTECPVPVLSDIHNFRVGAFAGNLKTTTAAYVSAKKSILCGSGTPDAPAPDVYSEIMAMLDEIKQNGVTSDQIEQALKKYLEENPIGGIDEEQLNQAVEAALEDAKASGMFDGPPGPAGNDGKDGEPGPAGADGKDYVLSDADKQEIAEMAADLIKVPEGSSVEIDATLKVAGKAADAKVVGDALAQLNEAIDDLLPVVTGADAGKFLRVNSAGAWVAETVANARGVMF